MRNRIQPRLSSGFTLVEAAVSAGIISSGLLAVLGLLSASLTTARDTKHQGAANLLADQMANRVIHASAPPTRDQTVEIYDLSLRRLDNGNADDEYARGSSDPAAVFICRASIDADTPRSPETGRRLVITVEYPASATEGNRQTHRYVSRAPF